MNMIMPATAVSQQQNPAQTTTGEPPGQTTAPSGAVSSEAVRPAQQTSSDTNVRDATAFAGKGAGAGGQDTETTAKASQASQNSRPPDATPSSILNAKVADEADAAPPAKPVANKALASVREADPEQAEMLPRPPLKLPDPLPTSPFLKPSGA